MDPNPDQVKAVREGDPLSVSPSKDEHEAREQRKLGLAGSLRERGFDRLADAVVAEEKRRSEADRVRKRKRKAARVARRKNRG